MEAILPSSHYFCHTVWLKSIPDFLKPNQHVLRPPVCEDGSFLFIDFLYLCTTNKKSIAII